MTDTTTPEPQEYRARDKVFLFYRVAEPGEVEFWPGATAPVAAGDYVQVDAAGAPLQIVPGAAFEAQYQPVKSARR